MSAMLASVNFQSQTTGRFARNGGSYRAIGQELELEFVPAQNFRIEGWGSTFASHSIGAFLVLRTGANYLGRAFPSTYATDFSIGARRRSA